MQTLGRSKTEQLQELAREYREEGQPWPASARDIAAWAIMTRRWQPSRTDLVERAARDIARSLREDYYEDPQGRRVRRLHAVRDEQITLWVDIADAEPEQMELAFSQRRAQILGDCKQLRTDVKIYNDNNESGVSVQMSFNFTEDLEELDLPTTYPGL